MTTGGFMVIALVMMSRTYYWGYHTGRQCLYGVLLGLVSFWSLVWIHRGESSLFSGFVCLLCVCVADCARAHIYACLSVCACLCTCVSVCVYVCVVADAPPPSLLPSPHQSPGSSKKSLSQASFSCRPSCVACSKRTFPTP